VLRDAATDHDRRTEAPLAGSARITTARWLGALDALAPYLIAVIAVAVARHAFASRIPGMVAAVSAVAILGIGSARWFFWDMLDSHLTWPVALVLSVAVVPLLALHVSLENIALGEPVAIQLLPLAFTWTALFIVTCLVIGAVYSTGSAHPGWAGVVVSPLVVLLGAIPLLSLNPSRPAVLSAILYIFALAEIASGVAWLIPERRRWYVIPALLILAVFVIGRAFLATPHHLPGRAVLIVDAALASLTGVAALASPLLCRWLATTTSRHKKGTPVDGRPSPHAPH
jgi:hypothetical protein